MKQSHELKLIHNSRGSWKEHIKPIEDPIEFMETVHAIVKLHGYDTYASFKASYKKDGGYAKNQETGLTLTINWKGRLDMLFKLMPFPVEEGE